MLQSGKVILKALTVEMHQKGSKCIDESMQFTNIPFPSALDKDAFNQNDWKDLKNVIQVSTPIAVEVEVYFYCQFQRIAVTADEVTRNSLNCTYVKNFGGCPRH